MNLIDAGNLMMLVEAGLGPDHAKVISEQWRAKCAESATLREALTDARGAVASLDPMALGGQHANHPEDQEHYIRDELLSRIDAALSAADPIRGGKS